MKNLRYMVIFPLLLIVVSIIAGWRCYTQVRTEMKEDLNQALQRAAVTDVSVEGVFDSLSAMEGNPRLTFNGGYNGFSSLLHIPSLRDTAYVSYSLTRANAEGVPCCNPHARICSDSIMLSGRGTDGMELVLEVKAYANPTLAGMFRHSGMAWPMTSFLAGLLLLVFVIFNGRTLPKQEVSPMLVSMETPLSCHSDFASICATLKLTPMQEQLMQMFVLSPTHTLSKDEICSALWPKKDYPDDTLYTFISRLKSSLNRQSSLRIENRRGREYILVDKMEENCPSDC